MIPISAFYLVLSALLIFALAINVVKYRRGEKVGLGDGGSENIQVAVRAHANALENIILTVFLMVAAELNGASPLFLHIAGVALLLSRVLHAWGFSKTKGKTSFGRFYGMVISWVLLLALCGWNACLVFPKLF